MYIKLQSQLPHMLATSTRPQCSFTCEICH
uniref:Uncharacterized protein n=1 Tax=Zea mays TaxID=4577 RepID=C4J7C0_MAIZE|nr:unknown [Zea mays]